MAARREFTVILAGEHAGHGARQPTGRTPTIDGIDGRWGGVDGNVQPGIPSPGQLTLWALPVLTMLANVLGVHLVQHMVLSMVVPILLVVGAPVTLALAHAETADGPAGARSPRVAAGRAAQPAVAAP